jgi:hypothetical protein
MKTTMKLVVLLAAVVVMGALAAPAVTLTDINLNPSVSGTGLFSSGSYLGSTARMVEGTHNAWTGNSGNLAPYSSSTNAIRGYITWSSQQDIRFVRTWPEAMAGFGGGWVGNDYWDQVKVDTLDGPASGAGTEANWVTRYTSGTGLNTQFQDIDLGATYTTYGIRVQTSWTNNHISLGEIEAFGPLKGTSLSASRLYPTSVGGSSEAFFFRGYGLATNNLWIADGGWLSSASGVNPGTNYYYNMNYSTAQTVGGLSVHFFQQSSFCDTPTNWEFLVDQGSGLTSLGVYSKVNNSFGEPRQSYYYGFDQVLSGVTQIQIRVQESDIKDGLGLGLVEFEAFSSLIPEPGSLLLMLGAGALLALRRRR